MYALNFEPDTIRENALAAIKVSTYFSSDER
jgi:hypothetical protein